MTACSAAKQLARGAAMTPKATLLVLTTLAGVVAAEVVLLAIPVFTAVHGGDR